MEVLFQTQRGRLRPGWQVVPGLQILRVCKQMNVEGIMALRRFNTIQFDYNPDKAPRSLVQHDHMIKNFSRINIQITLNKWYVKSNSRAKTDPSGILRRIARLLQPSTTPGQLSTIPHATRLRITLQFDAHFVGTPQNHDLDLFHPEQRFPHSGSIRKTDNYVYRLGFLKSQLAHAIAIHRSSFAHLQHVAMITNVEDFGSRIEYLGVDDFNVKFRDGLRKVVGMMTLVDAKGTRHEDILIQTEPDDANLTLADIQFGDDDDDMYN